jgi:hypothetical protein
MFNGEPDRTCHLPDLRVAATENAQAQIDGSISANSYVSTDGAWVISYARSAHALLAMRAIAGPASPRGRMRPSWRPPGTPPVHRVWLPDSCLRVTAGGEPDFDSKTCSGW